MNSRKRLFIGTVDDLFRSDSEEESELAKRSKKDIESFKSGIDDNAFNASIQILDEDDKFIDLLNESDTFNAALSKRTQKFRDVSTVRNNCKLQAKQFGFDENLFNRIPMWVFRSVAADDPLCRECHNTTKLELICLFVLINDISPDLMMSFYIKGGQSVDDAFRLHKYLTTMKKLHRESEEIDLIGLFGDKFTFHLATRTLRRIDMSIIQWSSESGRREAFLPDNLNWKRERIVRNLIRNGQHTIEDDMDIRELYSAWMNGLRKRGRNSRKK